MKIEELSKSQIVLLTLLVSFMTSIATGIVTVSLMDQAPPAITQSVDRIIERTVEKVVPGQAAAVVTTKTVIVKESDLIAKAVEAVMPSVVRLYSGTSTESTFHGLGLVLDPMGTIVADAEAIGEASSMYALREDGGEPIHVFIDKQKINNGLIYINASTTEVWKPAPLSGASTTLGQTVIALSGKKATRIEDGIVTALIPHDQDISFIDTNIGADWIFPGTALLNTDGEVVGFSAASSRVASESAFVQASVLQKNASQKSKSE